MLRLIFGAIVSKALYAAAKLGIADELASGPLPVDELARRACVESDALHRVLRALAAEGLFTEVEPRVFDVTPLGGLIGTDAPGSLRFLSVMFAEQTDPLFDHIVESVRTGEPAAERVFGKPYFDWLAENPEASEIFNKAMAGGAPSRLPALLQLDCWSGEKLVVDVGGGNGTILTGLLREHPQLRGIVFDQPHVASEVDATVRVVGLADRCSFVGGNFFVDVPANGDVYILAFILHDWGDEDAGRILTSCRRAVRAEGRLVLLEQIVPDGDEQHPSKTLDLQMLLLLGGRERTEADWRRLLAANGFDLERITPGPRVNAIEARPA